METFRSRWIKSILIFHHWITNLTIGCLYKSTGEIWAIGSSKIQIWSLDEFSIFSKKKSSKKSAIFSFSSHCSMSCSMSCSMADLIFDLLVPNRYITDISMIFLTFSRNSSHSIISSQNRFGVIQYLICRWNIANKIWNFNP